MPTYCRPFGPIVADPFGNDRAHCTPLRTLTGCIQRLFLQAQTLHGSPLLMSLPRIGCLHITKMTVAAAKADTLCEVIPATGATLICCSTPALRERGGSISW